MKKYNLLSIIILSIIAGFAFLDGLSSSIDFLNVSRSLILSIIVILFYILLFILQKREYVNFKGNSTTVNLSTLGILLSFWIPLILKPKSVAILDQNPTVSENYNPIFKSKDDGYLNILIKPFESPQNCNKRIVKYESFIENCINNIILRYDLPIRVKVLDCNFSDTTYIFNEMMVDNYNSLEQKVIKDFDIGLYNGADIVLSGYQSLLNKDSLKSEFSVRKIDFLHFDHAIFNMSHSNSSGLSNQYDAPLLIDFKRFSNDTSSLQLSFLSSDPFIHSSTYANSINGLVGSDNLVEIQNKVCQQQDWIRKIISYLLKSYIEEGNFYSASRIYKTLLDRTDSYEQKYSDILFSDWILRELENDLAKKKYDRIDRLVDTWVMTDTESVLSMNLILLKLRSFNDINRADKLFEYFDKLKERAQNSKSELITYILAKYLLLEMFSISGFTNHELSIIANDNLNYIDLYDKMDGDLLVNEDLNINISSLNTSEGRISLLNLEVILKLLEEGFDFSILDNSFYKN